MVRNTASTWGWPAKALHWIGTILIVVLILHGWWMTHMTPRPERFANYAWHAAVGYDLLALTLLRLLWRWMNPTPALPSDLRRWERLAAHAGHIGLYVLMFAAAVSGWALAGTFRRPLDHDLFGLRIPAIGYQDSFLHDLMEESHMVLSYLLAALVVLHVAGALRHHFAKHNDVLRRMIVSGRAS